MGVKSRLTITLMVLLLAGCKTTVQTQVKLTELLQGEAKAIPSTLTIEVASCNDYQDSRKPSSSLLDVQKHIPAVFKDAEYVECFRQKMDSLAKFNVPVYLSKDEEGIPASNDHLSLVSNKSILLAITVPEAMKTRLGQTRKEMMGMSLDMNVLVEVTNDTGTEFPLGAIATFIDDQPVVYQNLNVPKDAKFTLRLSDVSVQTALAGAYARVLYHDNSN